MNNFLQAMSNPTEYVKGLLRQNPALNNNPIIQNAMSLASKGDNQQLETIANNLAKSKGIDLNQLRQQLHI